MRRSTWFSASILALLAPSSALAQFRLDPPTVTDAPGNLGRFAFDGTNFWVTYLDSTGSSIRVARFTPSGVVLDAPGTFVGTQSGPQSAPAIACGAGECMAVWGDGTTIRGVRISTAGVVLDAAPIDVAQGQGSLPDIVFDGTHFVVAWWDAGIVGTRIDASGAHVDTQSLRFSTSPVTQPARPSLAWDGTHIAAVWSTGTTPNTVRMMRMEGANRFDATETTVGTSSNVGAPVIASDGAGYLVSFAVDTGTGVTHASMVHVVDNAGTLVATAVGSFGRGVSDYSPPAVSTDGTEYLVLWSGLSGERVASDGTWIDTAARSFAPTVPSLYQNPTLAFGAGEFVVGASGYANGTLDGVYAARVMPDATLVDTVDALPVTLSFANDWIASAAFDGTDYLLLWNSPATPRATSALMGTRVDARGAIVGTGTVYPGIAGAPVIAFNGTDYLAAFADSTGLKVFATRIAPDGTPRDVTPIQITPNGYEMYPGPSVLRVASNGQDFLVVWRDGPAGPSSTTRITASRVSGAGALLDSTPLVLYPATTGPGPDEPWVASVGSDYRVVWSNSSTQGVFSTGVSSTGTVSDPGGAVVIPAARFAGHPAIAASASDYLLAWREADGPIPTTVHLRYSLMNSAGVLTNPAGVEITSGPDLLVETLVAYSGNTWLVSYYDDNTRLESSVEIDSSGSITRTAMLDFATEYTLQTALVGGAAGQFLLAGSSIDPMSNVRRGEYRLLGAGSVQPDAGSDAGSPADAMAMDVVSPMDVIDASEVDASVASDVAVSDVVTSRDVMSADTADAGSVDAAVDVAHADAAPDAGGMSHSGCSTGPTRPGDGPSAALLALATFAITRRRRREARA